MDIWTRISALILVHAASSSDHPLTWSINNNDSLNTQFKSSLLTTTRRASTLSVHFLALAKIISSALVTDMMMARDYARAQKEKKGDTMMVDESDDSKKVSGIHSITTPTPTTSSTTTTTTTTGMSTTSDPALFSRFPGWLILWSMWPIGFTMCGMGSK